MGSRLERTERLLNLVFCLMAAQRPVPRATIRSSVAGYDSGGSTEAFERMFERDKEELRSMGIPIDTVLDVNGDVAGYRILQASYRMIDIGLSAEERAATVFAARVWQATALSQAASLASLKLTASGAPGEVPFAQLPQFARLTAEDARLIPILRSSREGRAISFTYRGVRDPEPSRRNVDPWAIVARGGRWYLIAHDRDRDAPRAFRLSRIDGDVTVSGDPVLRTRPDTFDPAEYIVIDPSDAVTATVTLTDNGGAELIRRATHVDTTGPDTVITLSADRETLLGLLTSSALEIREIAPSDLAGDVAQRLARIVTAHEGPDHGH